MGLSSVGIVPLSRFPKSFRWESLDMRPSSNGIVPLKLLFQSVSQFTLESLPS